MSQAAFKIVFRGKETEPIPNGSTRKEIEDAILKAFGGSYVPGEGYTVEVSTKGKK